MSAPRVLAASLLGAALVVTATVSGAAYPRPGHTEIASVSSDGTPKAAEVASISADGRYVAFVSADPTIVIPDTNPGADVFVHDRKTGTTELVSVSSAGVQAAALVDCRPIAPAISGTGRYVGFYSNASTLVAGDDNDLPDVFVHDRKTGETELISVSSNGRQQDGRQQDAAYCEGEELSDISISGNGRYVAFVSPATNLVPGDTDEVTEKGDVFVRDREKQVTEVVSVASGGKRPQGGSSCAALSANGRFVGFSSSSPDLAPGDANGMPDTFVHDRKKHVTELVSVASDGTQAELDGGEECRPRLGGLSLSATGRFVAFSAGAGNLVPNDAPDPISPGEPDVFVHDRKTGLTERVSVTSTGEEARGFSFASAISADGRFVAFDSLAHNLHPDDANPFVVALGDWDVFVHDRRTGATSLISTAFDGRDGSCDVDSRSESEIFQEPGGEAFWPSISGDGRYVSFTSCDVDLAGAEAPSDVPVDHIFVRDQGSRLTIGMLAAPGGAAASLVLPARHGIGTSAVRSVPDDANDAVRSLTGSAEILSATVVFRPQFKDMYMKIDLERISGPRGTGLAGDPAIVYGARFSVGSKTYEVRAHKGHSGPLFGLFECTEICTEVAKLRGGYGTVGDSIVTAIPLERIGLDAGGTMEEVEMFSGVGTYASGTVRVLDEARLR